MRKTLLMLLLCWCGASAADKPNIVLILADDLGYGDVGAYGGTSIQTPNIDSLASDGIRLTQFYSSGNVCTPSRAGLLTGRYPIRTGLADRTVGVGDTRGLKPRETTVAEVLRMQGYATALVGKWHLGDRPEFHPSEHGFDEFFGVIHSNDVPDQPLVRGKSIVHEKIDAQALATQIIDESIAFIESQRAQPFFLFVSSTAPHKPLLPTAEFAGTSNAGAYGDVVEELDRGVGRIMEALERTGRRENTLVMFTSDNGPFPQGSTGGLRGHKGTGWEGGYRVPFIAYWPTEIPANGVSDAMAMNIDLFPTLLHVAGAKQALSADVDGKNIFPVLAGEQQSPHDVLYFFNNERIAALRTRKWRLMLSDYPPWRDAQPIRFEGNRHLYTLLYDMEAAPDQQYDLSRDYPRQKKLLEHYLDMGRKELESLSTRPDDTQFGDDYKG
ncbi:sulfatase family protein [Elongatibacter sediminis]|uniref:Sulfatase n=1 Tax=Elongatibacter sediminis TaxID=3119006 RepID=A0AAW9RJW4_9GAMM